MAITPTERINVIFPKALLDELRRYVPPRERSAFIVRATERELRRTKLSATLCSLLAGPVWTAEEHPGLSDEKAIDRAVAESRATWRVSPEPEDD
ncbi:MAG: hypothetical protein FJ026_14440 [Chloroflexi bacterium]|nr:hypothetical protein [Chloroflexota bacterium]